jgi:hypothetical protein
MKREIKPTKPSVALPRANAANYELEEARK